MQRKGDRFVADWKDANGRRHRKTFATELAARQHEDRMIATSKLAFELGRRIARGVKAGPTRKREVEKLVHECSKIAVIAAMGKRPSSAQLNQAAIA